MPIDRMPNWAKGMAVTAARLAAMVAAIRANRVRVVPGNGLAYAQSPSGMTVWLNPPTLGYYALLTTTCPAFSGSTLGKGAGTLYQVVYSSSGVCTLQTTGVTGVPIYNPGNESIASGQRVRVIQVQGAWHAANHYC